MSSQSTDIDIAAVLTEEGLPPQKIIRYLKQIIEADVTKVFEVDNDGKPKLRKKILPKHAVALAEVARDRIRFCDKTTAIKLLGEWAKLAQKSAPRTVVNDNRRQGGRHAASTDDEGDCVWGTDGSGGC